MNARRTRATPSIDSGSSWAFAHVRCLGLRACYGLRTGHAPVARTRSDESGRTFRTIAEAAFEHVAQAGDRRRSHPNARPKVDGRGRDRRMTGNVAAISGMLCGSPGRAGAFIMVSDGLSPLLEASCTGSRSLGADIGRRRYRSGCGSSVRAHMTTMSRSNTSGKHPCRKRQQ